MTAPRWLLWAQEIQALAQNGLTYCKDSYDRERYLRLQAIAAEMIAEGSEGSLEHLAKLFALETGYATPKAEVRAVVIQEGRILMVREASDGLWALPGGWADVGQTPREAVERELREETGFEGLASRLLAVYDRNRQGHPPHVYSVYRLFFRCEIVGGQARPSHETPEVGFFPLDALPELSIPRILPQQIERLFALHDAEDRATDFD